MIHCIISVISNDLIAASRTKKTPHHPAIIQQQQQSQLHPHSSGSDDKKSKKSKILEVITFKKSPSITSKDKEAKKQKYHEPRLEPVEIAHLETLKVILQL